MKDYSHTLHVDASPEEVFSALTDPEFQSSRFMTIEVVKETKDGVGTQFRYDYELLGKRLGGGTGTYVEYVPGERFKWDFEGGPEMLLTGGPVSSTWIFEPAEGGTDVTVRPEFKTRIPVLNHFARGLMVWSWRRSSLPKMMAEVEKRAGAAA